MYKGDRITGVFMNLRLVARCFTLFLLSAGMSGFASAKVAVHEVRSPDGSIVFSLHTDGPLAYSLVVDGKAVVSHSAIELDLAKDARLGAAASFEGETHRTVDTTWTNDYGNNRNVRDHFNEVELRFKDHGLRFSVIARAYDEGAAFRLALPSQPGLGTFTVTRDATEFTFPADARVWTGKNNAEGPSRPEGGFVGSQEWQFLPSDIARLNPDFKYGLPFLVQASGIYVAVTESDLLDWAGMWLQRKPGTASTMTAALASPLPAEPWPARIQANGSASGVSDAPPPQGPVQDGFVVAKTPHNSPWRVFLVGRHPVDLLGKDLVLNLATPNRLNDISWVRPGMASWGTWWPGTGHNDLATIEKFIDLAADMGWPYQLTEGRDRTIVPAEVAYGKERNVRIWLWFHFNEFADPASYRRDFPKYAQMGVAGLKIDFIDRDDQWAVNWYEDVVKVAAENHLMIDFHGAYKPTGLERTYPNQITREGIQGNEYNKWSTRETPEHRATLPFTRGLAGPADYTPGGFLNRQPAQFVPVQTVKDGGSTQVQSTRAGELAMFLLIQSPFTVACDSVENYKTESGQWKPEMAFLKALPTTWDETRGLAGEVGQYAVEVRRHGNSWYLAAITDSDKRDTTVPLSFLGSGNWKIRLWQDASDSADFPEHIAVSEKVVRSSDELSLKLAPSGGMVAILSPE
jgi:alpha-glucosidase